MINESLYEKFRITLLRSISICSESICGFFEGLENFKPIISINYISDDTTPNTSVNITTNPKNISDIITQSVVTQSIVTQSVATQTADFIDNSQLKNDYHRVSISTKDSEKISQKISQIIENELIIAQSDNNIPDKPNEELANELNDKLIKDIGKKHIILQNIPINKILQSKNDSELVIDDNKLQVNDQKDKKKHISEKPNILKLLSKKTTNVQKDSNLDSNLDSDVDSKTSSNLILNLNSNLESDTQIVKIDNEISDTIDIPKRKIPIKLARRRHKN
jgi:hypothetical protein